MKSKTAKFVSLWIVLLILLNMVSLAFLFERIMNYSAETLYNVIPLIESSFGTHVTVLRAGANGQAVGAVSREVQQPAVETVDQNGVVYRSETQVEIFRLNYSGQGGVTVHSADTDKVLAPGTENQYRFTVKNTGNVPLDYDMKIEAWVSGTDQKLPIRASVWDYQNRYLLGSPDNKENIEKLDGVSDKAKLSAHRYGTYTIGWEWPFEQGNDEFDTMLGNMAVDTDIALTVKITTTAAYDGGKINPDEDSNPSRPSDSSGGSDSSDHGLIDPDNPHVVPTGVTVSVVPIVLLAVSFFVILIVRPRKKNGEDTR